MDKYEILRKFFGHGGFREGQEEVVDNILGGRDCLCVMPTGAGKSVCYQIPALMLGGTAIVISPLISLMQCQVEDLLENGISAAYINSSLDSAEYFDICRRALAGELKIIYAAPERLVSESFMKLCEGLKIPLVAVDEAHCVSHWGQDFRPSYLKIADFIRSLRSRPTVAAFTATATDAVKNDIERFLELNNPFSITTGFDRPNLFYEVRTPESKDVELLSILKHVSGAIVYCSTRKNVENVGRMLCRNGIKTAVYHAGFSSEERKTAQEDFLHDRVDVIVATNAFGMGIDKSNVPLVVHYNVPKDLESYYQEAGRAGRDGSPARCILLYSKSDIVIAKYMIERSHEDAELSLKEQNELKKRDHIRLKRMLAYCETSGCLRGEILRYFGERTADSCGNCGNCAGNCEVADVTVEAQKILSCIFRLKQRHKSENIAVICSILIGSTDSAILANNYQSLSTYGIMKETTLHRACQIAEHLVKEEYIELFGDEKRCVLTPKADEFIKSKSSLIMRFEKSEKKQKKKQPQAENKELFEQLRELRKKTAAVLGVPPYVVFSDASLWDMCSILPKNHDEFLQVSGVGARKAERYGKKFLAVINEYSAKLRSE
ncbi:MAG: DNA helicase RecQ [Oscillospiraceae bacterium]|nr:DNA helicase RecQ [Oscillospiraceae bacterium]